MEEAGGVREVDLRTGVIDLHGLCADVAVREAVDAAEGMKWIRSQAAEVAQRVVPVARALAAEECPRFPSRVRFPEQLRLAEARGPRIDVLAGDVVHREAVAPRIAEAERG